MNRFAAFVTENAPLAWGIALSGVVAGALLTGFIVRDLSEAERLSRLQTEAARRGTDILSQTLTGSVTGALSLLGVVETDIKRDALALDPPNRPRISALLENVAYVSDAEGVFVVGGDGLVRSSWNRSGPSSTGLDVRVRPYFATAMQGRENVSAAVTLARGTRALYIAAPVRATTDHASATIGAVVALIGMDRVDRLLHQSGLSALLLSPQGVVFAASRPDWIWLLAATASSERQRLVREGMPDDSLSDTHDLSPLPFPVEPGRRLIDGRRHAVATASLGWNDPSGDWTLVLIEDLSRGVSARGPLIAGISTGGVMLLIGALGLAMLRGHHTQVLTTRRIEDYAHAQRISADRKANHAEAALNLQRAKSVTELGGVFLTEAHRILGTVQGMVYAFPDAGSATMHLIASYACDGRVPPLLEPGQGLLGQCALDREIRVLETTRHESWIIRSGLGNSRPAAVMLAPLLLDESVLGVVEVALLAPPDPATRDQFAEMAALLALNLEIQRRYAVDLARGAG